jgi:toxin ParE1/3/4
MRLRYTRQARRDIEAIAAYITQRNPVAAKRVGDRIRRTVELLSEFPFMGHPGRLMGTQEFVVPGLHYIIVYRVAPAGAEVIEIVGVHHGARNRS